ncbi:hypothetical protein ACTL6P_00500 [Endozoicomonas acroporae]|uniref:hypothetical protein n=1 Tax=Endozoicomonas acroporae TaxID=1701104 RepID=UPI000C7836A7|nr:hypothetical protein [Endozoicomonas acroporae]
MWSPNHPSINYYDNLDPDTAPEKIIRSAADAYYAVQRVDSTVMHVSWAQEIYIKSSWYCKYFVDGKEQVNKIMFKDDYKYGRSIRSSDRYYSWILDVKNWVVHHDNDGNKETQTPEEHGFSKGDVITKLGVVEKKGSSYVCFYEE